MKYKIPKFKDGGGWATFTPILYSDLEKEEAKKESKSESKESKRTISSLLDDKVFEDLMGKGLSNDVNNFVNELIKLESSGTVNPFAQANTRGSALKLMSKINELKNAKDDWKETIATAQAAGGYGEVAVGNNGEMFAKDAKGAIHQIDVNSYNSMQDKSNIKVLTVAELMNERQNNPKLAGQNSIFNVGNNSIGFNKITDQIKGLIGGIGSLTTDDTKSYSKESLTQVLNTLKVNKKPTEEEQKSIQELQQILNTPSEFYKINTKSVTNQPYVTKALNYIWSTLGTAAQNKLTAVSATNGVAHPKQFILDMLMSQNKTTETTVTPEGTPGSSASGSGSSTAGEKSLTQFQMFHKDKLMQPNNTFAVNDPKFGTMFRGIVGGVAPLMLPNGDNIGMNTVGTILNSGYNQILKDSEVYFGNKKVSRAELDSIVYDGSDAAKVYMPVDNNGKPDYESLEQFKNLYTVYEANKDKWDIATAERYFKKEGYNIKIDEKYEDGKRVKVIRDNKQVKPFLVMYGMTNDATSLVNGNENWLTELTSDEESLWVPKLEQIWTVGKGKDAKKTTPSAFWNIEEYYKGMIAIPYRPEATAIVDAMVGQGAKEKSYNIADVQRNLNYSSNQPLDTNISVMNIK